MSSLGGFQIDIRVPNVFGSFEATLGVMGADAFLLFIFLICSWKLSSKDVAKPFLCILSLCMLISTVGTICLFVFKMCKMANEASAYASVVRTIGRFASVNALLFGGGYFLLGAGNAARTRSPSFCCSSWFIHLAIAVFSGAVAGLTIFSSSSLEHIPLALFKIMPTIGVLFLLFTFVMGFFVSCCGNSEKEIEHKEKFLVDAKSRYLQYALFFIEPVAMIVLTRALDGGNFIYNYLRFESTRYWDRNAIARQAMAAPMIPNMSEIEMFFTISVCLCALILHPSVRNVFCCSAKTTKTKIAPIDATLPSYTSAHPMIMTPMMVPHPQMAIPSSQIPSSHPIVPPSLPILNQYPVVYGMGGRPAYMMA